MLAVMRCKHQFTKNKLVAWAIVYRGQHEQGFVYRRCCAACGVVIESNK